MKNKYFIRRSFLLLIAMFFSFCAHSQRVDREVLKKEIKDVLVQNILQQWYPRIIDSIDGGFYTNFNYKWEKMPRQEKMIVTQSRGVWTACKAAELFPNEVVYKRAAAHGVQFLKDKMWDKINGGFYTNFSTQDASMQSGSKMAYGNAFAIYALAAYVKLTKNADALNLAREAFYWLEKSCHDSLYGGYYDYLTREGISAAHKNFQLDKTERRNHVAYYKDFNSSIHILEAFTELYHVWPDKLLRNRLEEMLILVRDTFTTDYGNLSLYFQRNWEKISYQDSSEQSRRQHLDLDHVSFGHDIETAYLILEASEALGEKDDLTLKVAKKLVDHTLETGVDPINGGIFDGGRDITGKDSIVVVMRTKSWWGQAEALNSMLLFDKLYPQEKKYYDSFVKQWLYMKQYLIDYTYGDWYINGIDTDPGAKFSSKATIWKCNYHNSRALMNCYQML